MDQTKTGSFIRMLRKEKQLTQEQMGEYFHVSRRTVSRWETGRNMLDLDVLIEMADYFEVDLRELLDGERKENKGKQQAAACMAASYYFICRHRSILLLRSTAPVHRRSALLRNWNFPLREIQYRIFSEIYPDIPERDPDCRMDTHRRPRVRSSAPHHRMPAFLLSIRRNA